MVNLAEDVMKEMTEKEIEGIRLLDPVRWMKIWLWNSKHKHFSNIEGVWTLTRDFLYFNDNGGLGLARRTKKFLELNFDKVTDHKWSTNSALCVATGWLPKPHVIKYVKALTGNVEITLEKSIEILAESKLLASVDMHVMTAADRDSIISGDFPFSKRDCQAVIRLEVETFWRWNDELQAYVARIPYRFSKRRICNNESQELERRSYALFGPTTWSSETRDRLAASLDGVQWDFVKCWPTIAVDEWQKLGIKVPTWERVLTGEVEDIIQDELEVPKQYAKAIVRSFLMTANRNTYRNSTLGYAISHSTNKLIVEAGEKGLKLKDISPTLDSLLGELIKERKIGQRAVLKAHPDFLNKESKAITCFEQWLEHEEQTAVKAVSKKLDEAGTHCLTREHDGETRISLKKMPIDDALIQNALTLANLTRPLKIVTKHLSDKLSLVISKNKQEYDHTLYTLAYYGSACPGQCVNTKDSTLQTSIEYKEYKSYLMTVGNDVDDTFHLKVPIKDPNRSLYSDSGKFLKSDANFALRLRQLFVEKKNPNDTEIKFMRSLSTCARLYGLNA